MREVIIIISLMLMVVGLSWQVWKLNDEVERFEAMHAVAVENFTKKGELYCNYSNVMQDFREAEVEENVTHINSSNTVWY